MVERRDSLLLPVLGLLHKWGHLGLEAGKPDQESDSREKHLLPSSQLLPSSTGKGTWLFSSCGEQGLLLGMMLGLLTAVASLVGIPRL